MAWLRKHWSVLILALVPMIPLWRTVFCAETIGPWADIAGMIPGGKPGPDTGWDVLQADGILQFYVWRDLVFEAWRHGQVPLWSPYQLAGVPILANSQSGALYPPHILLGLLQIPTPIAVTLLAWFHLAIAGLGISALVQRLGGVKTGGVIAGATFALSTFMLSWTGLASVITTGCWIPWALALVVDVLAPERQFRFKGFAKLSGVVALMLLGGHLQFAAYGIFAILAWTLWVTASTRTFSLSYVPLLSLVAGGCLAAPQVLPVLNYSQFSHRRNSPTEEGFNAYNSSALRTATLATLAFPNLDGDPRESVPNNSGLSLFAPKLVQPGANLAEQAIGFGPLIFVLLVLSAVTLKRKDLTWGIGVIGLLALWVAMGSPINRIAYFYVPGWSSTGSPGRISILFILAACTVAGVAASHFMRGTNGGEKLDSDRVKKVLALSVVPILLTVALSQTLKPAESTGARAFEFVRGTGLAAGLQSGLIGLTLTLGVLFWANQERSARTKAALIALVPILAILNGALTLVPTGDSNVKLDTKPQGRIANRPGNWDINLRARAVLPPNLATLFRIEELGGYDSLLHRDTVEMMREANGEDAAPPVNGNMMFVKKLNYQVLANDGVTEIWNPPAEPDPILGPIQRTEGLARASLQGPGIADVNGAPVEVQVKRPNGIDLKATGPGKLTVRYRKIEGWTAKVNGRNTEIGGTRWIVVKLPSGEAEVTLTYTPPGMRNGLLIALVGIFVIVGGLILSGRKRQASQ